MRLVLLSDTHEKHQQVQVPDGDILIHAGDLTMQGKSNAIAAAGEWLRSLPHQYKIVIAGNHDLLFEKRSFAAKAVLGRGIIYLEDSGVNINGINFWGSPVTPRFCDWAFNVNRGAAIRQYWNQIPENTDVLITHGPPQGILDEVKTAYGVEHHGCEELWMAVGRVHPKIHVFGHIHEGYGRVTQGQTQFINASVVDTNYQVVNPVQIIDF